LNDTGVTACFGNSGPAVSCPQGGFPGQDGATGRDVTNFDDTDGIAGFSFTKLDSTGNDLPAGAPQWTCVRDNVTGLVWEIKTASPGTLQSADNTYTWYSSDSTNNGNFAGTLNGGTCVGSRCDTESYIQAVNQTNYCGRKDWRMPDRNELNSIIRLAANSTSLVSDPAYFPLSGVGGYWTGTTPGWSNVIGVNGGSANYVAIFAYGSLAKANAMSVMLVSGEPTYLIGSVTARNGQTCQADTVHASTPTIRFVDLQNGGVTDKVTRLTWMRCPLGRTWDAPSNSCLGLESNYTWEEALTTVQSLDSNGGLLGFTDWRLPNYKEIQSIAEAACVSPGVNLDVFPIFNVGGIYVFWTSTTVPSNTSLAARMSFNAGFLDVLDKTASQAVLLVRGP
jgi:hypothetical protein